MALYDKSSSGEIAYPPETEVSDILLKNSNEQQMVLWNSLPRQRDPQPPGLTGVEIEIDDRVGRLSEGAKRMDGPTDQRTDGRGRTRWNYN